MSFSISPFFARPICFVSPPFFARLSFSYPFCISPLFCTPEFVSILYLPPFLHAKIAYAKTIPVTISIPPKKPHVRIPAAVSYLTWAPGGIRIQQARRSVHAGSCVSCLLPAACCRPPAACCLLLAACCPLLPPQTDHVHSRSCLSLIRVHSGGRDRGP